jgi:hypothetical protein
MSEKEGMPEEVGRGLHPAMQREAAGVLPRKGRTWNFTEDVLG